MANVLYISLTGMTEALGESQVLQYLLSLAANHRVHLCSFEKRCGSDDITRIKNQLNVAGINWIRCNYSNRFGIISSIWQITLTFIKLSIVIRKRDIQIIHARSMIPAVIGALLTKLTNAKLLFDIRGFAIDEKIMEGRLKEKSFLTNTLKYIEKILYLNADHIITLTHKSKMILSTKYNLDQSLMTVIPTCANKELFYVLTDHEKCLVKQSIGFNNDDIILLRNGSINASYDYQAEFFLFKTLMFNNDNIKLLLLNNGQHELITSIIDEFSIPSDRYKLISDNLKSVNKYLNIADVSIFFVKPCFAKQASAPTKFAEMVACHLFVITNDGYGDMDYYLNTYPVGKVMTLTELYPNADKSAEAIMKYIEYIKKNGTMHATDFDELFNKHFSKDIAIQRYEDIYTRLINETN